MKYRNETEKFITFSIPQPNGSVVWLEAHPREIIEVPDLEGWRAEAHGLKKVISSPIKVEEIKVLIESKPKKKKKGKR